MADQRTQPGYRTRPGAIIGHCKNWPRILDYGHPITAREAQAMLRKIRKGGR